MSAPNPYQPPEAPVADQDRLRGSPVKGMLFGVLVDIGGTLVAGVTLGIVWSIWLAANGMNTEQIEQMTRDPDPASMVSILSYAIGTAFSVFGGYVCARVARETEFRCAAVVAAASITFGFVAGGGSTFAMGILMVVTTLVAVMVGAWLGKRRNERQPS